MRLCVLPEVGEASLHTAVRTPRSLHPLLLQKAPRVLLLAALTLALTSTAAAAKPAPAAFRYWAGCEAPAYCQPADGPNLKSAVPIVSKSAKAVPKAAITSPLWGTSGERFNPAGRLMDWSFAGYKQGNEPIPTPPVTKSYKEFQKVGGCVGRVCCMQAAAAEQQSQPGYIDCCLRLPHTNTHAAHAPHPCRPA